MARILVSLISFLLLVIATTKSSNLDPKKVTLEQFLQDQLNDFNHDSWLELKKVTQNLLTFEPMKDVLVEILSILNIEPEMDNLVQHVTALTFPTVKNLKRVDIIFNILNSISTIKNNENVSPKEFENWCQQFENILTTNPQIENFVNKLAEFLEHDENIQKNILPYLKTSKMEAIYGRFKKLVEERQNFEKYIQNLYISTTKFIKQNFGHLIVVGNSKSDSEWFYDPQTNKVESVESGTMSQLCRFSRFFKLEDDLQLQVTHGVGINLLNSMTSNLATMSQIHEFTILNNKLKEISPRPIPESGSPPRPVDEIKGQIEELLTQVDYLKRIKLFMAKLAPIFGPEGYENGMSKIADDLQELIPEALGLTFELEESDKIEKLQELEELVEQLGFIGSWRNEILEIIDPDENYEYKDEL